MYIDTIDVSTRPIDTLHLHPSASLVPMPSGDDLANLSRSLAENGQQDPIDRTITRRHLTRRQRKDLNALLSEQVVEVKGDKRIGYGQTQRAKMLGVGRTTIQEWDRARTMPIGHGAPTHFTTTRKGKDYILPMRVAKEKENNRSAPRPARLLARPKWVTLFVNWSNRPLEEYRPTLIEMQKRIDKALATLDADAASHR